jgi:LysM repeat protein
MYKLSHLEACPMKKLFGVLFAALVIYIIYFDLTVGTLPTAATKQVDRNAVTVAKPKTEIPSFEAKVKPGETLISIVEHYLGKSLPVSINDLIEDFQQLNPGISAEKMKIGATYHFPDYSK